jgi:hypothetical protein
VQARENIVTTIQYPIPYELSAKFGKNRTHKPIVIADTLECDIKDVAATETQVAVSAAMTWATGGLPGQGPDGFSVHGYPVVNDRNPKVDIRLYNESFYAPVMKFSLLNEDAGQSARPIDLQDPINNQFALATPFSRPYESLPHQLRLDLERQSLGRIHRYEDSQIKEVAEVGNSRDAIVEMAQEQLAEFIAIEGVLWQRLIAEPRIRYQRQLVLDGDDQLRGVMVFELAANQAKVAHAFHSGIFNINRLQDAVEHINDHFPDHEHIFLFDGLDVKIEDAFTLSEEADALTESAMKVVRDLSKYREYLVPELLEAVNRLNWLVLNDKDLDEVAGTMQEMLPHLARKDLKQEKGVRAAIGRWNLRPTDLTASGPRI